MAEKKKTVTRKEITIVLPPIKAPGWLQGFVDFVREQGVVGLAVGLTLGIASKSVVDSLVANIFNPLIGVMTGGDSLGSRFICVKRVDEVCAAKMGFGQVISDLLSFVIVLAIVYFVVKGLKLDKLDKVDKKKDE
ncbi:MAG: MscL family protein [Patescibacteria group bacterium]